MMPEYLIVCDTKRMAKDLLMRLAEYIEACYGTSARPYTAEKGRGVITSVGLNARIRFVSNTNEHEARKGFRGLVVRGRDLDKFLDPWERDQASAALRERFAEVL